MDILIKEIKQLVTCRNNSRSPKSGKKQSDIGLIENGNIFIEDDKISFAGNSSDLKRFLSVSRSEKYEIIDGRNKVITPGFIDSHTHFVFAGSRENEYEMRLAGKVIRILLKPGGKIIYSSGCKKNSKEYFKQEADDRLKKFVKYGTTTLEGKSGYGLDLGSEVKTLEVMNELNRENKYGLDIIPTFLGAHSVPPERS